MRLALLRVGFKGTSYEMESAQKCMGPGGSFYRKAGLNTDRPDLGGLSEAVRAF